MDQWNAIELCVFRIDAHNARDEAEWAPETFPLLNMKATIRFHSFSGINHLHVLIQRFQRFAIAEHILDGEEGDDDAPVVDNAKFAQA